MAQKKRRSVKIWTELEEKLFAQLAKAGVPTDKIARQLKRTAASIRSKAQKYGLSLGGAKKAGGAKKRTASKKR